MQFQIKSLVINQNNKRSMDDTEIDMLAESIKSVGMFNPITVYYDKPSAGYVVLSGHKRLEALKRLGKELVECNVVEKPDSLIHEKEAMLQANMHRSTKEDIMNEVAIAESIWESMPKPLQDKYSDMYRKEFKHKKPNAPLSEFRPKNEYILHMTGLTCSYRTVQDYMSEAKEEKSELPKDKKEKKKKKARDPKSAARAFVTELQFMVSPEYEFDLDDTTMRKIEHCIDVLKTLIE